MIRLTKNLHTVIMFPTGCEKLILSIMICNNFNSVAINLGFFNLTKKYISDIIFI